MYLCHLRILQKDSKTGHIWKYTCSDQISQVIIDLCLHEPTLLFFYFLYLYINFVLHLTLYMFLREKNELEFEQYSSIFIFCVTEFLDNWLISLSFNSKNIVILYFFSIENDSRIVQKHLVHPTTRHQNTWCWFTRALGVWLKILPQYISVSVQSSRDDNTQMTQSLHKKAAKNTDSMAGDRFDN